MNQSKSNMTVSSVINDALTVVSKNPMIVLIFLIPALLSLFAGMAVSGGAGVFGEFNEVGLEDGNFDVGDLIPAITASAAITVIVSIISILVSGIAIAMTSDALENRQVNLNSAIDFMSNKWLPLIVAAIILAILQIIGVFACCIGYVVVVVATVFVRQGIVLDNMEIGESFSNSFNWAKQVWPDILILFIIQLIATVIIGIIPYIGAFLGELISGFFVVAFTIYYIGLTHVAPEPQSMEESTL